MTERAEEHIDAKRPWITNPREAPSAMNWADVFLNPFGRSPTLHFTRAWTLLFFARVGTLALSVIIVGILSVGGVEMSGEGAQRAFLAVVIITCFLSFIIHMRRLADAGRPVALAGVALLPLIAGAAAFVVFGSQAATAYDKRVAAEAAREAAIEQGLPVPEAEETADRGRGRGRAEKPQTKTEAVIGSGIGGGMGVLFLFSFFVMLWSLLWVARQPSKDQASR